MKYFYKLVLIVGAIMTAGVMISSYILKLNMEQEIDIIAINKIAKITEQHWPDLSSIDYENFPYPIAIIDHRGELLLKTSDTVSTNVYSVIQHRQSVIDLVVGDEIVGKAIIHVAEVSAGNILKSRLSRFILLVSILLSLFMIATYLHLYITILHPFKKLQAFASHVSKGDFDAPIQMDRHNVFGAFTESFDIMREALREARQKEALANESKQELVASLSHDIKTPVTSIKLLVELLLLKNNDPWADTKLNIIYQKSNQIDQLITNMLHSVLEELKELHVAVLEEDSALLYTSFKNADLYGRITIDPIPSCMISIDKLRLDQVINNIISNSYKYAGTPIHVQFHFDQNFLSIDIDDSGSGIDKDEIAYLFQKFYRGTHADHQKLEGEGLGLYISKLLMDKMDGGIECYNLEQGFRVRLFLRLAE